MVWTVELTDAVQEFLLGLESDDRNAVLGSIKVLESIGPHLGRPHADVLVASRHSNMKELRTSRGDRQYRVLFAFDSRRMAILLVGGEKLAFPGGPDAFYKRFIKEADDLFDQHKRSLEVKKAGSEKSRPKAAGNRKGRGHKG